MITGIGEPLYDRLLQFDAAEMSFQEVMLSREPACPVCGDGAHHHRAWRTPARA